MGVRDQHARFARAGVTQGVGASLSVRFAGREVGDGEAVDLSCAAAAPEVAARGLTADTGPCVIYCYDPDAPCAAWPVLSDIPHLLVTGVTAAAPRGTATPIAWLPPAPPLGVHRYVFLLCRSAAGACPVPRRACADTAAWLRHSGLEVIDVVHITVERQWGPGALAAGAVFTMAAVAGLASLAQGS
eukprot:TRINITY_DN19188_c0_g1_i1.p1 TRINITY_DN19188_c0_g1~~TRINITY_DN19188_c0_g1_i1.p1  ORF type:complete len:187 (+),score=30.25 TRINITY_DN19188_c0_g1_i1:112-672(+)